jgi:hypothetical protein
MSTEKHKKRDMRFECIECEFKCYANGDWLRHIATQKHLENMKINNLSTKNTKKLDIYLCKNCNKQYRDRTGLWRHKSKCNVDITIQDLDNNSNKDDIIQLLLKQNNELIKQQTDIKEIILEIVKNGTK